ncbi:MAG: colanic acid biosynthesis glycosyltransferase WcaL [Cyanothece sp. SIO1E1]|nr:colanic acid biosynthesis glycosyltransferase WcaL [Cyanothece sp. SIO1E1]
MKIAFILEEFPVLSQTFVLNQVTGLMERGWEVDIYAQKPTKHEKQHPDVEKFHVLDRVHYHPRISENDLERLIGAIRIFFTCFFRDPFLILNSLNFLKFGKPALALRAIFLVVPFIGCRRKYDVICCHFGGNGLKGMLLRDLGVINGKLVTAFHGVDISQNLKAMGEDIYDELFKAGNLFLPACENWQRRLLQLNCVPNKIIVHRMGIDPQRFIFQLRQIRGHEPVQLITVARLTEKKGLEYSIRAVAQVAKQYPNLRYDIIGSGDLKPNLEVLIQELNLEAVINLLGSKTQSEVFEALSQAHLFLHPSVTADNGDQEASPVSIQEAMATGLPIISTYHGGIPELVEDDVSGFLVPERDENALAEKLIYLINHPERWADMGAAGRQKIDQQHNIHRLNDRLVQIYEQLLDTDAPATSIQSPSVKAGNLTPTNP